jgi:hypothetical protein
MDKSKSGDFPPKFAITFDTESDIFEEIKAVITRMDIAIPDDSPFIAHKNRFDEVVNFFLMIYRKNQALLQKIQDMNVIAASNAAKTSTILRIIREDGDAIEKYKRHPLVSIASP